MQDVRYWMLDTRYWIIEEFIDRYSATTRRGGAMVDV